MSDSSATAATMMADVTMKQDFRIAEKPAAENAEPTSSSKSGARWLTAVRLIVLPVAILIALVVHQWVPDAGQIQRSNAYPIFLLTLLGIAVLLNVTARLRVAALRRWLEATELPLRGAAVWILSLWEHLTIKLQGWLSATSPLMAAGLLLITTWEFITIKLGLLPIMYFPPPERILSTLYTDRAQLFNSTWHSLTLLVLGYIVGVMSGLLSGIMIGWSGGVRYWGMPVLKIIGPIPATAWIPLALVMFPQSISAGVFLISLSVWFPVTMLTASGVSNVRASYLDVARTLGAGRRYLIFKVAIPAAMPSIFIGLFMGLGTSFVTLLVAESTGVSSGLGWYIDWARNYSDYAKVFAALVIMAVFFSTIMSVLFMVRDRVLVWQKGVIKW